MSRKCPDFDTLQAVAETGAAAPDVQEHVSGCGRCRQTVESLRGAGAVLAELGRAERSAARTDLWSGVAVRLERPRLAERLPLGMAGTWRAASEIARPAATASLAAGAAGLLLGSWLAVLAWRGPGEAVAADSYRLSSLLSDSQGALASTYIESFEMQDEATQGEAEEDGAGPDAGAAPADTGTSHADSSAGELR
ncbi:MAG: hypothetical protein ACE5G2_08045 [Candidatus Krumholzibacteriia bacterium]